jgi:hypothetical protein
MLRFVYSWGHRLKTVLFLAKIKDDSKIKIQTNLDRTVQDLFPIPTPSFLITDYH